MKRRTFLAVCTGLTPLLHAEAGEIRSIGRDVSLSSLLPELKHLPPEYEDTTWKCRQLVGGDTDYDEERDEPLTGFRSNPLGWDTEQSIRSAFAQRIFSVSRGPGHHIGRVKVQASLTRGEQAIHRTIEKHHENQLWRAFGRREPTLDYFSGWYDTDIVERTVNGHRQTRHWRRSPQMQQWADEPAQSERPYNEYALLVQSTGWGVLEVEVEHTDVDEKWQTRRLARRLMTYMNHPVTTSLTPTIGES